MAQSLTPKQIRKLRKQAEKEIKEAEKKLSSAKKTISKLQNELCKHPNGKTTETSDCSEEFVCEDCGKYTYETVE
jgi:predicted translin family RNA/ssDNA-binding protein